MRLPDNYRDVLRDGITALEEVVAVVEQQLAARPDDPDLLLRWRNVSGLAVRLADEGWDNAGDRWVSGFAIHALSGQDVGVLAELEAEARDGVLLARSGKPSVGGLRVRLARLREFLQTYLEH